MERDRTADTIQRIADALSIPVSALSARGTDATFRNVEIASQEAELLSLFSGITDPATRADCLNYVRIRASAALQMSGKPID